MKQVLYKKSSINKETLVKAVSANDVEKVKLMIKTDEMKEHANATTENGKTILIIAIVNQNLEMVKVLLDAGADVNKRCHIKTNEGIEYTYFINKEISNKRTLAVEFSPLALAILTQDTDIIKLLLKNGAEITSSAKINKILSNYLPPIKLNINILELATLVDNLDVFRLLLVSFSDRRLTNALHNILLLAGYKDKRKILSMLLKLNIKVKSPKEVIFRMFDQEIENPLCEATLGNCYELVKLLLKAGFDQNISNYHGDSEFIDNSTRKAIHIAARRNYLQIFNLLLENGADINAKDNEGKTPLHLSLENDCQNYDIVDRLIEMNADVNISNNKGDLPLHVAISYNQFGNVSPKFPKILAKIIQRTEEFHQENLRGKTPLHLAATTVNIMPLEALIASKRVNLNIKNNEGQTALHHAAADKNNYLQIKLLTNANADLNVEDNQGRTPLFTAALYGNIECIKALIEAGAEINPVLIGERLLIQISSTTESIASQRSNPNHDYLILKVEFDNLKNYYMLIMSNTCFKDFQDEATRIYKKTVSHELLAHCLNIKIADLSHVEYVIQSMINDISFFVMSSNKFSDLHKAASFENIDTSDEEKWTEIFQVYYGLNEYDAKGLASNFVNSNLFMSKKEFNKEISNKSFQIPEDVVKHILIRF